jgi:hypothetical protein
MFTGGDLSMDIIGNGVKRDESSRTTRCAIWRWRLLWRGVGKLRVSRNTRDDAGASITIGE